MSDKQKYFLEVKRIIKHNLLEHIVIPKAIWPVWKKKEKPLVTPPSPYKGNMEDVVKSYQILRKDLTEIIENFRGYR